MKRDSSELGIKSRLVSSSVRIRFWYLLWRHNFCGRCQVLSGFSDIFSVVAAAEVAFDVRLIGIVHVTGVLDADVCCGLERSNVAAGMYHDASHL